MKKLIFTLAACALLWSCGEKSENTESKAEHASAAETKDPSGLSAFEMENGIGPIKEKIPMGALDKELAEKGEKTFEAKCSACHKLDQRYVGPALGEVTKRRTPEYIMNMALNPAEMVQKHPVAKELLGQFMTPMPFQNVTKEDVRSIVEFFRAHAENK